MTMSWSIIWKKAILVVPLWFGLWWIKNDDDDDDSNKGELAVWRALYEHPPSMRVFRALSEIALLLGCTCLSLKVWSSTKLIGNDVVGTLLFAPPPSQEEEENYQLVSALDDEEEDNEESESTTAFESSPQPPSATSVLSAMLDLILGILVSLLLFTLSCIDTESPVLKQVSQIAAPMFPLCLFVGTTLAFVLPWSKRRDFWTILIMTMSAPFCQVEFRDGFVGDVFTSMVRPMQDLAFTVFYLVAGLRGWWSQSWDVNHADTPVERSWVLHTVVLPACMVSPLWWRFLQNLRQAWEQKTRWPYLGNALKYMVAAEVAMFGVFDPTKKQHFVWIGSFVIATLYQVWWDVFMDWELLELSGGTIRLRSKRLYPSTQMYWYIFGINFILRFCWTLSFLPQVYLLPSGLVQTTFEGTDAWIAPTLACAEIIRRTLWGWLRLELETIKIQQSKQVHVQDDNSSWCKDSKGGHVDKMEPMSIEDKNDENNDNNNAQQIHKDTQLLGELCLWATAFCSLGIVAAAHRQTM